MLACTFTITAYGTSGNELPPRAVGGFCRSVLSGSENEQAFRVRMQKEGMDLRALLAEMFEAKPKPYSCADTCDWAITEVGSVADIVKQIYAR